VKVTEIATTQDRPVRGKLLRAKEAIKYINCGHTWFFNRLAAGKLPFPYFQLEYGKRYDTADLDDFLRRGKDPMGVSAPVNNQGGSMK